MINECEVSALPRETVVMRYVLYLSRVRRNWIEQEIANRAGEARRRVLGETYEVPTVGQPGKFHTI